MTNTPPNRPNETDEAALTESGSRDELDVIDQDAELAIQYIVDHMIPLKGKETRSAARKAYPLLKGTEIAVPFPQDQQRGGSLSFEDFLMVAAISTLESEIPEFDLRDFKIGVRCNNVLCSIRGEIWDILGDIYNDVERGGGEGVTKRSTLRTLVRRRLYQSLCEASDGVLYRIVLYIAQHGRWRKKS